MLRMLTLWSCLLLLPLGAIAQPVVGNLVAAPTANALRFDISFTTSQAARGFVEYVQVVGPDSLRAYTGYTDSATTHGLVLMGLVPQATYHYRAVAFDATGIYPGPWETLTVPTLPIGLTVGTVTQVQSVAGSMSGFLLSNTAIGDPDRYVQAHDRLGRLVWYERMPGVAAPAVDGPCQTFHYDRGSNTLLLSDCGELRQVALDGSVLRSHNMAALAPGWWPHHDIAPQPDGRWLVLVARADTIDKSSVGGDPNAIVVGPGIVEVGSNGQVLWTWSAFDHLDPLQSPGPGGDWVPKLGPQAINWLDANSVLLDGDDNPLLSLGGTSNVVKVARSGGNVVWTLGPGGSIDILPPDSMAAMHSLRRAATDSYLSLDNQGLGNVSRIVEWRIDFDYITPLMERIRTVNLPLADHTADEGNVDPLPDGGFVVGSHDGRSITELTSAGSMLWRAQLDSSLHKAYWLESFYHRIGPRYLGDTTVCLHDSMVALRASVTGGIWSGDFVVGDSFDVAAAGVGPHLVSYRWGPESFELYLQVDPSLNCGVGVDAQADWLDGVRVWPNPTTGALRMDWEQPRAADLQLAVHGLDGRLVLEQGLGVLPAGRHGVALDAGRWGGAGAYVVVLRDAQGRSLRRIVQRL